ncbi:unnamed protein product [Camellia sinensis]
MYQSLHHTEMGTNYSLFMPLYYALGNTLNSKSWDLHKSLLLNSGKKWRVPDFVFLAHVVDITASLHSQFVFGSFALKPFRTRIFLLPIWPLAFIMMLVMWAKSKTFSVSFYNLIGRLHHTWAVPRFGFQYFLPFAREGINKHIEEAILRADRFSLAALNKLIVQMLTLSIERFEKIQKEAPTEFQKYLVQVTKYQAAKN